MEIISLEKVQEIYNFIENTKGVLVEQRMFNKYTKEGIYEKQLNSFLQAYGTGISKEDIHYLLNHPNYKKFKMGDKIKYKNYENTFLKLKEKVSLKSIEIKDSAVVLNTYEVGDEYRFPIVLYHRELLALLIKSLNINGKLSDEEIKKMIIYSTNYLFENK